MQLDLLLRFWGQYFSFKTFLVYLFQYLIIRRNGVPSKTLFESGYPFSQSHVLQFPYNNHFSFKAVLALDAQCKKYANFFQEIRIWKFQNLCMDYSRTIRWDYNKFKNIIRSTTNIKVDVLQFCVC